MSVNSHPNKSVSQPVDLAYLAETIRDAIGAVAAAVNVLDDIGAGMPPAEQAHAYHAAAELARRAWDALADAAEELA